MSTTSRMLEHPDLADVPLTAVLFALSDPARLDLVRLINEEGPQTVAQCHTLDPATPKSTFSHHLKTLRQAGLIRNDPDGRRRTVSLRRAELDDRYPGLLDSVLVRAN